LTDMIEIIFLTIVSVVITLLIYKATSDLWRIWFKNADDKERNPLMCFKYRIQKKNIFLNQVSVINTQRR
jgi:hypothetical protein